MKIKTLFTSFLTLVSLSITAQDKVYAYSQFQTRNEHQEWGITENICGQLVHFTENEINLNIDKNYRLSIISKTDLPDKGIIYLCSDEKSNPVTIMLIDNTKMYFYNNTKRFLINFDDVKTISYITGNEYH